MTNRQQEIKRIAHPRRANGLKNGVTVETTEKIKVATVIVAAKGNDSNPLVRGDTPLINYYSVSD